MQTLNKIKRRTKDAVAPIAMRLFPVWWKQLHELHYWKNKKKSEDILSNEHYRYFYTTQFGLNEDDYQGKTIVDIGCGPRGSLEWASMASRRIGIDPLADEYKKLGADRHQMEYINAPSERMPFEPGECDIVCSFNSLDHVEDVDRTIDEIKRITRVGGKFLLLVEVNHEPTDCEPHYLTPDGLMASLKPEFRCENMAVYKPLADGVYESVQSSERFDQPESMREPGYMAASFTRTDHAAL